jgi:hypothetical protein
VHPGQPRVVPILNDAEPTMTPHLATKSFKVPACPLALSIAVAIGVVCTDAAAAPVHAATTAAAKTVRNSYQPSAPQTWTVQNCSNAAAGSLRDIIENPLNAHSGDTVDLSQLPALCAASDSTITLSTGQITVSQDSLTLVGPEPGAGSVTISGGGSSRVFKHSGAGGLAIERLHIANGYYHNVGNAFGGCILQPPTGGSLYLLDSSISGCTVASDSGEAIGGGIFASSGGVTLVGSTISGNRAHAPANTASGGGIFANQLATAYSSISGNVAGTGQWGVGRGGGVYVLGSAQLFNSTLEGNSASYGAGARLIGNAPGSVFYLVNSTLSHNTADVFGSAFYAVAQSLKVWNTTIASNHDNVSQSFGGPATFVGPPNALFELRSTIIANNTSGPSGDEADLYFVVGSGTLAGDHNLVMTSNISPPGVIALTADPMLGPLQLNGGQTKTHMPMRGSPVIEAGINPGFPNEQRGPGYPRTTGGKTDMGSTQFDSIFYSGLD